MRRGTATSPNRTPTLSISNSWRPRYLYNWNSETLSSQRGFLQKFHNPQGVGSGTRLLGRTFVDVKDSDGRSALHFAAAGGKIHICKYLVQELKLDVNMKDGEGLNGLLRLLISRGVEVGAKSDAGTPLQCAVWLREK